MRKSIRYMMLLCEAELCKMLFDQKGYCKDLAFTVLMLAICTAVGFCFLKAWLYRYEYCHDIYPGCIVDGSGY